MPDVKAQSARTLSGPRIMRLLSDGNLKLLGLIRTAKPQSLSELSKLSGRPKASLTRTLQRLSALGIVVVKRANGRGKIPIVVCDRLRVEMLLPPPAP
jgi:predicted transcriptional regulator